MKFGESESTVRSSITDMDDALTEDDAEVVLKAVYEEALVGRLGDKGSS